MSDREFDPVSKLPKLTKSDDYIIWKRRVFAYIRKSDAEIIGFDTQPASNTPSVRKKWFEQMIRAKSTIILCLGDSPLAKVRRMIDDDDVSAKALWDELEKIYTASNAQSILNLRQEMDDLRYEEGRNWDDHVNKFTELLSKLATYDEELSDKEKASKLLRTLPEAFSGFAMIAQVQDLELERLIQAMHAEISRRKSMKATQAKQDTEEVTKAANFTRRGKKKRGQGHFAGRISKPGDKNNNTICYVCGKKGHYARDCWYRSNGNNGRGRGRGRGHFRGGHGRGRGGYYGGNQVQTQGWSQPGYNFGTQMSNPSNSTIGYNINHHQGTNATPQANVQQLGNQGPSLLPDTNAPFQCFMAQIKRSKLASINTKKTNDALIDSGATHLFFHSNKYFIDYKKTKEEDVHSASGLSRIVGVGQVYIPLDGGIYLEAYHAPEFGENILSVSKLSRFFDIRFSTDEHGERSACYITSKRTGKLIFKTDEVEGLYKLLVPKQEKVSYSSQGSYSVNKSASENINCVVCATANTTTHGTFKPTPILEEDKPMQWHFRTGHPSPLRYYRLAQTFPDVPYFPRSTLEQMFCIPCQQGKARRSAVLPTPMNITKPLELVHTDISGPVVPSLSGNIYSVGFMDARTAKSDVFFLKKKSELSTYLTKYKARSELQTGCRLQKLRLDGAGENMSGAVETFCNQHGIQLDPSPPYAHQSNGTAERLIQELWARTRVLLFASKLPAFLWAEAMSHANWLRNRLPSSRVQNHIPMLLWNPSTRIQFCKVPVFGQPGFAFKYRSDTVRNKKFLARSVHAHFVGMESDETLFRVFVPDTKSMMLTRAQDFHPYSNEKLPGVASILDGLSRQSEIEGIGNSDGQAEDVLMKAFQVLKTTVPVDRQSSGSRLDFFRSLREDSRLPSSFREAILYPEWRAAIDREYKSLRDRGTWEYVKPSPNFKPVPFTWVFRLKPLDNDGKTFLHKARCVIRGDRQKAYIDFDPQNVYAPVACHEAIRILLAYAASESLQMEGADISNAYLYGKIDIPINMAQPTDSPGILERPGMVCRLLRSIYGLRQAGEIWGSLFCNTLLSWGFRVSNIDKRMFFLVIGNAFVILVVVVDDMKFVSNSTALMDRLKVKLASTFDVKLFGQLQTFIGWEIRHLPHGIKVTQTRYAKDLLTRCRMNGCNAVWSLLPTNSDLTSSHAGDIPLQGHHHSEYRSLIGALIHLAVCTRPDLSFAVCSLARHVHAPTERHRSLLKRVLRYLAGTTSYGLQYKRQPITSDSLVAHVDADWGGDMETRHSTTGYIVSVNGGAVNWKSQRQTVIALSSAESEYIAMSSCAKQVTWLRRILWEIGMRKPFNVDDSKCMAPTHIFSDSTADLALVKNNTVSSRNKHIDIKVHHLKELWRRNVISVAYVPSRKNVADLFTKPVAYKILKELVELLMLSSQDMIGEC